MDLSQNVEDQNRKQMQNVSIQNVSHLQKQDLCQKDKDVQLLKEKNPGFRIRRLTEDDLFKMKRRPRRGKPAGGKTPPTMRAEAPKPQKPTPSRSSRMGGGLMEATQRLKRQGLRGGGICKKGMNKQAVGKNS